MVSANLVFEAVKQLLNRRKHKLLLAAESAMPSDQFRSFRKQVLNELGLSGFLRDLQDVLREQFKDRQG
jgi:hypothetical protein